MSAGKILTATHNGCYLISLAGDVRVTLCKTIDDFYDAMFHDAGLTDVTIDLSDAEGIDSTTLGLLAKLAIRAKAQLNLKPTVYSPNPGITRLLGSMGFERIFSIQTELSIQDSLLEELPIAQDSEDACRNRVIEAHRVLMGMNEKNRAEFQPLLTALEYS